MCLMCRLCRAMRFDFLIRGQAAFYIDGVSGSAPNSGLITALWLVVATERRSERGLRRCRQAWLLDMSKGAVRNEEGLQK